MKVAIYCRVSTEEQTTENQKLRLEEYAKRMNWDFETIEETMSTRKTRPKKNELLQRLRHKEFDGLLIYKLDRWGRSVIELTNEVLEIHNKGIRFISFSENIDLKTAIGELQSGLTAMESAVFSFSGQLKIAADEIQSLMNQARRARSEAREQEMSK